MTADAQAMRDISYAVAARTRGGRAMIRIVENATGRLSLLRRARGYDRDMGPGSNIWQVLSDRYGLSLDIASGALDDIPATGPLVLIANHPFGILDGLMMGHILAQRRRDFRILANAVFRRASVLNDTLLPIDFEPTRDAQERNLRTRALALAHLGRGGAIGIFPGGTVSTARKPFGAPIDPLWRGFTAKLIARTGAAVLPVYFDGHNSRLFQIASHLSPTLRLALLLREFRSRVNTPVTVAIGQPIAPARLDALRDDPKRMMDFLRQATYELSPRPLASIAYGFEFETKYRE